MIKTGWRGEEMRRFSLRLVMFAVAVLACFFAVYLAGCSAGSYGGDGNREETSATADRNQQRTEIPAGSSVSTLVDRGERTEFRAVLSGSERIPPVNTQATGSLLVLVNERTGEIEFELRLEGISRVAGAYINLAPPGENGPPIAPLFTGPPTGDDFSGVLARGKLTSDGFMASLRNKSTTTLIDVLKKGNAYCNVQTERWPIGELRGQIK